MRRLDVSGPGAAVAAAILGGAAAMITAAGLSALARPADRAARLAEVERKLDRLEVLQRGAVRAGPGLPRGAVCRQGVAGGTALVDQTVRSGLGQAKLQTLAFEPSVPVGDSLMAVNFRFEVVGPYQDALALMQGLDRVRPIVFADTVDLTSRTSSVSLQFAGHFYCSTSARL